MSPFDPRRELQQLCLCFHETRGLYAAARVIDPVRPDQKSFFLMRLRGTKQGLMVDSSSHVTSFFSSEHNYKEVLGRVRA